MKYVAVLFLIVSVVSCQDEDRSVATTERTGSLAGSWILIETGYSPGGGYVNEAVSTTPPQTLTFSRDLTMNTNIAGIAKYKFYRVVEDSVSGNSIVLFFEEDPGDSLPDASRHGYWIAHEDKTLKLNFRGCIEGCHMRFKRLSETATKD